MSGRTRTASTTAASERSGTTPPWWRTAVVYEIYPRSFADSDGDGVGDIRGMAARLPYLRDLGVDAVWITPWYASPMADGGYDVADFRAVAPELGALRDAEEFIRLAHAHHIRVMLDLVPNHTSAEHAWFHEALVQGPGSPAAQRYWVRPGRGPDGVDPPNDWRSVFGGAAWSPFARDGQGRQQWYLHLFAPEQPDLDWTRPQVLQDFDDILRFWFDRGVDGFRIDVAHGLAKDPDLPDLGAGVEAAALDPGEVGGAPVVGHPHWDREEIHEIFRHWRALADSYEPPRVFVAEAWRIRPGGLARYVRVDELHTAFNFDLLGARWDPDDVWERIAVHLDLLASVSAPATWVLGSHDITRVATRLAEEQPWSDRRLGNSAPTGDPADGWRRARAIALLVLALPGSVYVYQGEELGLPEVEDLPDDVLTDPMWRRSGHRVRGRDGCRVPIPWTPRGPAFGFTAGAPWLPMPPTWGQLAVESQLGDPGSTLAMYRAAIAHRRSHDLGSGKFPVERFRGAAPHVLTIARGTFRCVVNFSATERAELPPGATCIVSSVPVRNRTLPPQAACWLEGVT